MHISYFISAILYMTVTCLTGCGLDCIDRKTGMRKFSRSLNEAREKKLFKYEFIPGKSTFQLDAGLVFNIKNAWVENRWKYECIDNKAEVVKDSSYQFIIDVGYSAEATLSNYWIGNKPLGAVLNFDYSGQDTIALILCKDTSYTLTESKSVIDTITFVKWQVIR